jgi:hypothetical protein
VTTLPRNYILRSDGQIEPCDNEEEFRNWFRDVNNRRVARSAVPYGDFKKAAIVSTTFLGYDASIGGIEPLFFETLAELPDSEHSWRHSTYQDALEGHRLAIFEVEKILGLHDEEHELGDLGIATKPQWKKQAPDAQRQPPDPNCPMCDGNGSYTSSLMGDVRCDCTVVKAPVTFGPQVKAPATKAADPTCWRCQGTGIDKTSFLPDTPCDCAIVKT